CCTSTNCGRLAVSTSSFGWGIADIMTPSKKLHLTG
ncbi:MAG: hypothetical protein ACI8SJ_002333, partial [Shewanella sp.]